MTTIDTLTTAQINALMQSAGEAGDTEMVAICERTSRLRVRLGEITAEEREPLALVRVALLEEARGHERDERRITCREQRAG